MRKILVILAMFFAVCPVFSQKISVDKVKDGYRVIQTERTAHVFLVKGTMNDGAVSLDYIENGMYKQYSIVLYFYQEYNIEKGAKLLLKLDNGEVIELSCSSDISHTYTGNAFAQIPISFVSYQITPEQLKTIETNNVVKLRAETSTDYLDGRFMVRSSQRQLLKTMN